MLLIIIKRDSRQNGKMSYNDAEIINYALTSRVHELLMLNASTIVEFLGWKLQFNQWWRV